VKVVGLMSGTSCDGVDAALVEVDELPHAGDRSPARAPATATAAGVRGRVRAFVHHPYHEGLRSELLAALREGGPETLAELHLAVATAFATATRALLHESGIEAAAVAALGSHGHTFWHRPPTPRRRGVSLQLGDAATLAAETGIPVVSDFRSADLAAGGHGAPLVPFADRHLLSHPEEARILLNVGGMANLTWLPPAGDAEAPVAFDTGPGNVLLDLAAGAATGGRLRCDVDGALAGGGTVDAPLLARLLGDPWFQHPPPRSTGREHFGASLFESIAAERGLADRPGDAEPGREWRDLLATLTALTAVSVADAVARWVRPRPVARLVVSGGGARNPVLVEALRDALEEAGTRVPVETGPAALGMDPDAREAAAFALLAWAHLKGVPGNVPSCTGARGPRVLGSLTPAPA
jgi:anhydro-N-acetylmuramic acid kinase